MAVGDVLRLFVIVAGAYMFLKAILSLAKRKMTEPFCLAWAVLSALMIFSGILLTESSKSPASIAKSNKQWVGTCLYQEECKLLLINCGAVIRL